MFHLSCFGRLCGLLQQLYNFNLGTLDFPISVTCGHIHPRSGTSYPNTVKIKIKVKETDTCDGQVILKNLVSSIEHKNPSDLYDIEHQLMDFIILKLLHYKETVVELTETCPNQDAINYKKIDKKLTEFCHFGQITVNLDILCQLSVTLDNFLSSFLYFITS